MVSKTVQLNYRDRLGRPQTAPIRIPDDAVLNMGGVSLTQDRRFVVVKMRAPWDGSLVEYTYRNPENLEIGDRAVVDLNHDLVIGEVASYGKKQSRSAYKAAYAMYSPLGIEEWS